jgi:glycosyltransferase involved in cell wall biosynthesis
LVPKPTRILFVHNALTEFVRLDLDELRKRFEVTERFESSRVINPMRLWQQVKNHDVVFGWFASWHTFLPIEFAKRLGKPSLLIVGGYDVANMPEINYGHQRGGLQKSISRREMHLATRVVTTSNYSRAEVARNAGLTNGRARSVYLGVPDKFGALPNGSRERMALTVGNVNRSNVKRKGHEPFVRAAALLPDVRFVVVGKWQDNAIDFLRSIASPNVSFTGRVSDDGLLDYYRAAAVYVQPSLHEGFGLSVAEAMLAGCIPVTTAAGSLPEVTGDCGVRLNSTEPAEIARAVAVAVVIPQSQRAGIRNRILTEFSIKRRREQLERIIESLVNGN